MTPAAALGFLLAVTPLALTPGVSFTLATQRALSGERRAGLAVAAGTSTGICLHSLLAAVGLAAMVARVAHAFTVIKVAGGLYLVALGLITLRRSFRRRSTAAAPARTLPWQGHPSYVQALVGNVLNPKAAAVYLTLAPQFLSPGSGVLGPMLIFAGIHAAVASIWLISWSAVVRSGRSLFDNCRAKLVIDRTSGGVLVALGLRTVLSPAK